MFLFKYYKQTLILLLIFLNSGCASLSYYSQSVQGQIEVFQKSRHIHEVLKDENISNTLHRKLNTVMAIRAFSIKQLGLPDNKSYLSYADLGRDYVVWNIFATEEFSLEPQQWCFLFVGCLHYRGYFSEQDAKDFAEGLKSKGMEVYLGGVSAYSTLGWFDDPLLNTMLNWSEARLAAVIFHELTHQLVYLKGDTEFNESLADAVGIIGVRQWLTASEQFGKLQEYENFLEREKTFVSLILKHKVLLEELYSKDISNHFKRIEKSKLFDAMRNEYALIKQNWEKDYYGNWMQFKLNNASMASVVSYRKYLPAFLNLYNSTGNNIDVFFKKIQSLTNCSMPQRERILTDNITDIAC